MINLLPTEVKQQITYKKRNSLLVKYIIASTAVVAMVALVMLAGGYFLQTEQQQLQSEIERKQKQLGDLSLQAEQARVLSNQVDTIAHLLEQEVKFSKLLPAIAGLIPNGAELTNLNLNEEIDEPLLLVANVDSQTTAAVLRENIESSDLFNSADIQSISPSGTANEKTVNIQVQFNPEAQL